MRVVGVGSYVYLVIKTYSVFRMRGSLQLSNSNKNLGNQGRINGRTLPYAADVGGYQLAAWSVSVTRLTFEFSAEHTDETQIFECSHSHIYLIRVCCIFGSKCGSLSVHLGSVSV